MAPSIAQMHDTAVYIKEEPTDDDDLFIPDAMPEASTAHQEDENLPTRARAADGQPFNSQCFQKPYLSRPQFHRLKCGHDIATVTVETCGANCHPPDHYIGSDLKPNDTSFECPHPSCKRQSDVIPRINPKTKKRVYGRACQLAHVRGRDSQADRAWDIEKKEMLARKGRLRARPGDQGLSRKTSRSPPPKKFPMQPPPSRKRRGSTILTAEEIGQQMDAPTRKLFAAQKGKHTRRPRGDRPETESDIKLDAAEQDFSDLGFGKSQPRGSKKGRRQPSTAKQNPAFREDNESSPDAEPEYGGGDVQDATAEGPADVHCVCKSSDLRFMVECNRCDEPFHPGCIGKGAQPQIQYELPGRDEFFEFDARNSTSEFLCLSCEDHCRFEAGISSVRRDEERYFKRNDLLLQFKPRLLAHKQAALARAEGEAQAAIVETHFKVLEQEMDTGSTLEVRHWKSLLAQALKVPLPPKRVQKRPAAEMVPDHGTNGPAARSPAEGFANRAELDSTRSEVMTGVGYQEGGMMTLAMGRPPQKAPRDDESGPPRKVPRSGL